MKRGVRIILICLSSLSLISWDKASKNLAKEHLQHVAPISYLHDTFRLEYAENTGAAMNIGDALPNKVSFWLLSILPLAALCVLFIYLIKTKKQLPALNLAAGTLILAGGIGNVSDRLLHERHVTDFMNIGLGSLRSGIFNFADVYITAGAVLFFVAAFGNRHALNQNDISRHV